MRFGEYLMDKEIIQVNQLEDALVMQMDNPKLKLGEILLSMSYITKSQLIENIKSYMRQTGKTVEDLNDWVTQEEADQLVKEMIAERG